MTRDQMVVDVEGTEVRITSPGRVVFPEQGWTKMDVVEHFLRVGPGVLRGVAGRPTMLKRYPKGVGGSPFYQKRAEPWMGELVEIRFPSQRPGQMLVPRTLADIVRMAQLNCLDLHPWPVRAGSTDHPDELRIDLDPTEGFGFADVREAAALVGDLLGEVGLVGWPKTSGSRGIHVYVRIEPRWTFHQCRRAVLALAREGERRSLKVTTSWWKEERRGVFIDYNQMARDKTLASPYSVRSTGLVSTPFSWDELTEIEPGRFPLDASGVRWETAGDPSEGIDRAAGRLDALLEWVERDEEQGLGDAPWPPHYPKQPGEPPRVQPSRRRRSAGG